MEQSFRREKMKYVIVLGDGMADRPSQKNNFKTALESACIPNADFMTREGICGKVKTVPDGMKPGSDVANLSVLGLDPASCYTGRSPIEALSMGLSFDGADVCYRANLVTLSNGVMGKDSVIVNHGAGEISTEEAKILIEDVKRELVSPNASLYPGVSYRHCLIVKDGDTGAELTPPHDAIGKPVQDCLPKGKNADFLTDLILLSEKVLSNHPVNKSRIERGLLPATSLWFWGEGRKPDLPNFRKKFGISGAMISAVDLLKGIAVGSEMTVIDVEGATGNIDTNYRGKAEAAWQALSDHDLVFVHVEAPDECAHLGENENKIKAIENIDREIIGYLLSKIKESKEACSVLFLPDHATPVELRTHTSEPVPFVLWRSNKSLVGQASFDEHSSERSGILLSSGEKLMELFLSEK